MKSSISQSLFERNLTPFGRMARGSGPTLLGIGSALAANDQRLVATGLGITGDFMLFEALRGWCVLRSSKIKTPF
jgi:hypothetical protein